MTQAILPVEPSAIREIARDRATTETEGPSGATSGFGEILAGVVQSAGQQEAAAGALRDRFVAGDPSAGIQEVMTAQEKAAIAVRYAVTLKNRALEAYRELMNTPV